jgi:hypothetical protein
LAAASFYLVERPVIEGTFWRSIRAVVPAIALVVATVVVILAGTVVPATAAVSVHPYRAGPAGTRPPVVVVLGDSMALTLSYALAATAPSGTSVVNGGLFGCGLAIGTSASNNAPIPELAMFPACNSATPAGRQWPAVDAKVVADTTPHDIVLFVGGYWETQDLLIDGRWTDIGQKSFQHYELSQMRKVVEIGTAHGAQFEFATMPAMASGAAFHEAPFPADSPVRRMIYNRLIERVARQFPHKVSVVAYGHLLTPQGVFSEYLDGVQVRTPDGVHTPSYAPGNPFTGNSTVAVADAFYDWLSPRLWPLIIGGSRPPASPSPASPSSPSAAAVGATR